MTTLADLLGNSYPADESDAPFIAQMEADDAFDEQIRAMNADPEFARGHDEFQASKYVGCLRRDLQLINRQTRQLQNISSTLRQG